MYVNTPAKLNYYEPQNVREDMCSYVYVCVHAHAPHAPTRAHMHTHAKQTHGHAHALTRTHAHMRSHARARMQAHAQISLTLQRAPSAHLIELRRSTRSDRPRDSSDACVHHRAIGSSNARDHIAQSISGKIQHIESDKEVPDGTSRARKHIPK